MTTNKRLLINPAISLFSNVRSDDRDIRFTVASILKMKRDADVSLLNETLFPEQWTVWGQRNVASRLINRAMVLRIIIFSSLLYESNILDCPIISVSEEFIRGFNYSNLVTIRISDPNLS